MRSGRSARWALSGPGGLLIISLSLFGGASDPKTSDQSGDEVRRDGQCGQAEGDGGQGMEEVAEAFATVKKSHSKSPFFAIAGDQRTSPE